MRVSKTNQTNGNNTTRFREHYFSRKVRKFCKQIGKDAEAKNSRMAVPSIPVWVMLLQEEGVWGAVSWL